MLNTTLVCCSYRRTISHATPRRLAIVNATTARPQISVNTIYVRNSSSHGHGYGHGHGHAPATPQPVVPPLGSVEYFKHYYGNTPAPKPGESWLLSALTSNGVLECLSEFSSSEFKVQKLTSKNLSALYEEQKKNFETVRKPALEKEGVSSVVIKQLERIYHFRASVRLSELNTVIKDTAFLSRDRRLTSGKSTLWRYLKAQISTLPLSPDLSEDRHRVFPSNEAKAQFNVKYFRGVRGLMKAINKGLTDAQKDFILSIVDKRLTTQDLVDIDEKITYIKNAAQRSRGEALKAIEEVFEAFPPGSKKREKFAEIVLRDDPTFEGVFFNTKLPATTTSNPGDVRARLEQAIAKVKPKNDVQKQNLAKLAKGIEFFGGKDRQKDLLILNLLSRSTLTTAETDKLLAEFEDKETSDELLNDVINPHPIAAKLWPERIKNMTKDRVQYTKTFAEGDDSNYPDISANPRYAHFFNTRKEIESPRPEHPPFNTAMEEVVEMKVDRLAKRFYRFDLNTDYGIAQLDLLTQHYDISPGEATLERTHAAPPQHHTYEELPIIKFDGFDPLSDDGIAKAAKAEAHGHH